LAYDRRLTLNALMFWLAYVNVTHRLEFLTAGLFIKPVTE